MPLFNKKYSENEAEVQERTDCLCKFRGTPDDYPGGRMPNPDGSFPGEEEEDKCSCGDACSCKTKSIVEDMTFGQMVNLINHLVKEVNELKRKLNG